jgi:hypothetical protein
MNTVVLQSTVVDHTAHMNNVILKSRGGGVSPKPMWTMYYCKDSGSCLTQCGTTKDSDGSQVSVETML